MKQSAGQSWLEVRWCPGRRARGCCSTSCLSPAQWELGHTLVVLPLRGGDSAPSQPRSVSQPLQGTSPAFHSSWPYATHTPSHPHQPSQKVADRFETYRLDLQPPRFAVNSRTRRAPIHLPALQEGHSDVVNRVRGIVRWHLRGKRLGPGRVEVPSRERSEMGSCACVAGHTMM